MPPDDWIAGCTYCLWLVARSLDAWMAGLHCAGGGGGGGGAVAKPNWVAYYLLSGLVSRQLGPFLANANPSPCRPPT